MKPMKCESVATRQMGELACTDEIARGIINKTPLKTMPGEDHQRCCGADYGVDTFRVQYSSKIQVLAATEELQAKFFMDTDL